jgi:hypothetical protein
MSDQALAHRAAADLIVLERRLGDMADGKLGGAIDWLARYAHTLSDARPTSPPEAGKSEQSSDT